MRLKTLYVRFYKSFNYDYLRKSHPKARPSPWDLLPEANDTFYPFVTIPMEPQITTIVGANESGKSQTLSAIKCLLTGTNIQRRDFCRYSQFFSVGSNMSLPEFGGEFNDLSDEETAVVRRLAGLSPESALETFHLFRFNKRTSLFTTLDGQWQEHTLRPSDARRVTLPTFFEINARIPLPDSVPIDYLATTGTSSATLHPRGETLNWMRRFREQGAAWFKSPEAASSAAPTMADIYESSHGSNTDPHLPARLALASKLLVDVAKIDRSAFEDLKGAVMHSEGYANGLVAKMNDRLAEALNFPKWWSQDSNFKLSLTLRDFDLVFTVTDRTGSDYSFSERSGGMSYFLSYFVQYLSHSATGGQEILLMDEPDAYLSTTGQQDLLQIFNAFAQPDDPATRPIQVAYVTHSPFLVDKNHGERVRVLEKGAGEEGTRVVSNASRNHYEPLRSAFGAFVAETTFIGNCNLMLEGPADQILLAGLSSLSRKYLPNGETLNLNALTLVPSSGAQNVPYMVYLATGRDVDQPAVTVLLDGDDEGKKAAALLQRGFRNGPLLDSRFVVLTSSLDAHGLTLDVDEVREIEDLIPSGIAEAAVKEYAKEVLGGREYEAFAQSFTLPRVGEGEKVFEVAKKSAAAALATEDTGLRLDKVGFARAVLRVAERDSKETTVKAMLENFGALFALVNEANRAAMRRSAHERTTRIISGLRSNFFRDHPLGATRRDAQSLIEDIRAQVDDTRIDAVAVRDGLRDIQASHSTLENPGSPLDDFAGFKAALEALTYVAVRESAGTPA